MEFGSILSGIGSIASAFGSRGDGIDVSENYRLNQALAPLMSQQQRQAIRNKWEANYAMARKLKVHPLYAMQHGSAAMPQPTTITTGGGSRGSQLGDALQGAGQIADGMRKQERDPTAQAMKALGLREAKASADQAEIQTELLRLQLERERQGTNAQPTTGGAQTFPADKPHVQHIIGADGVARPISVPNLSEKGEPHYGEGMDIEAMIQWWRDRGQPMLKDTWRGSQVHKDLAEFGRAIRAFMHNNRTGGF